MLKDIEISRLFSVPVSTLQDWKKSNKDKWRYRIYTYLKLQNSDEIKKAFEVLNKSVN